MYKSFIETPRVTNVIAAPDNEHTRVRIQNYSDVNPVALRRVLTDPNLASNATLNQTFATLLLAFDRESQLFKLPENLTNPPKVSNEPGKSRIWNDFTFQEIGKGDEFLTMESIVEKDPDNPQAMSSGIAPPHPFLSIEKASRVNQWVVERAEMETDYEPDPQPEPEPSMTPQPDVPREPLLAPTTKKIPGIRTRKAATGAKTPQPAPIPEPMPEPGKPSSPAPEKMASIPRKRWKMQYDSGAEDNRIELPDRTRRSSFDSLLDLDSNSLHSFSTTAALQTPNNNLRMSVTFDPTKYGLSKSPQHATKNSWGSSASPKSSSGNGENLLTTPQKKPRSNDLIGVFAPITNDKNFTHPLMSFDQPALIPQKPGNSDTANSDIPITPVQDSPALGPEDSFQDLLGLESEKESTISGPSSGAEHTPGPTDANGDDPSWQEEKLRGLKRSLQGKKRDIAMSSSDDPGTATIARPPTDRRQINMFLARQKLAELEKNVETLKDTDDETSTREFHHTMNHKAAKPGDNAKSKAEAKAKRQATLEDAWGIIKKPEKKPPANSAKKAEDTTADSKGEMVLASEAKKPSPQDADQMLAEREAQQQSITGLFETLKPALEAAEYFSGPLTLEAQLGLILIPLLPKTYNSESLISVGEWTKIFQPRNGLPAPTAKFINRLTTAGSDVDHIVDLKTSKAEGKRHLFEQDYTEYNVSYEFHCRTTADQPFIIAIDEQGKHSIRKPATTLGAVNLHFPQQTWDASVVLGGVVEHISGSDPELEEAVQYLVDYLWVQPDRSLVRIFSRLPKGNKYVIEKVLMKRYTRHRHIRPNDPVGTSSRNPPGPDAGQNAVIPVDHEPTENQDIFLQVLEVQDLLIGSSTSDSQALRARCAPHPEMIKKNRLWYEVSLVSSAIETFLKSNMNVEIGERTEDWRSSDLMGRDAMLVSNDDDLFGSQCLSPVAMAIGSAGLGNLLQLTKTVVEKIDGIGFWNYGPGVEAVHVATAAAAAAAGGTAIGAGPLALLPGAAGGKPPTPGSTSALALRSEQRQRQAQLLGLDDLDSIKEVESVMAKTAVGGGVPMVEQSSPSSARQHELDYW